MVYTVEQKAQVIEIWPNNGTAETARVTGVHERTIIRWVTEAGLMSEDRREKTADMRAAGAEQVARSWADFRSQEALAAGAAANRMRREVLEASEEKNANLLKARIIAYGIFIDKAELLSGQATQRIQVWAESEVDRELREAIAELEARIRDE